VNEDLIGFEKMIGRPPEFVESGMSFLLGDIAIDVLWPDAEYSAAPKLAGDGSEENNRSVTLMIKKDDALIFAGGDIEPVAQAAIAKRYELSEVDIYKVSHHGSGFRDLNFDRELRPSIALISVGDRNPYGHPDATTLETLAPARILRTDIDGAIRLTWWPLRVR
jgi:competence protein ComEC